MKISKKTTFAVFFCVTLSTVLFAHPHLSIVNKVEFVWNEAKLQGAYLEWELDHFYSADIIGWLDEDGNGQFDERESELVYRYAFINLRHYYFYTFIRQGSTRTNPSEVEQFRAEIKDGQMVYRFYIDLSSYPQGDIYLAVYDYTFFSSISYSHSEAVKLNYNPSVIRPKFSIVENKDFPVYYNPLGAVNDKTVYYKWKKGLQTYYPKEIRISYE